jgi:hypothetical protein
MLLPGWLLPRWLLPEWLLQGCETTGPATDAASLNRPAPMAVPDIGLLRGGNKFRDVRELKSIPRCRFAWPRRARHFAIRANPHYGSGCRCRVQVSGAGVGCKLSHASVEARLPRGLTARAALRSEQNEWCREGMRGAAIASGRALPDRSKGRTRGPAGPGDVHDVAKKSVQLPNRCNCTVSAIARSMQLPIVHCKPSE